MTIETPNDPIGAADDPKEKRRANLARAREAKRVKAQARQVAAPAVPAPSKPVEEMTDEEKREYRRQLLEALMDVPNPDVPKDAPPGSLYGEGPIKDKKDFTPEWFQKTYALKEVMPAEDAIIRVNGVGYRIFKNRRCWLPEPHYEVYMDTIRRGEQNKRQFAPPENPGKNAGYISPVHEMGSGFFHTAEQADALNKS